MFPKKSEISLIKNWRYLYICPISGRKYANKQTDKHRGNSEKFGTSVTKSKDCFQKNQKYLSSRTGNIPIFVKFQ